MSFSFNTLNDSSGNDINSTQQNKSTIAYYNTYKE